MRAITFYQYGPPSVLKLEQRPTPSPGPGQVLLRVHACALNAADWHILRADPWLARLSTGLFKPKHSVLGCDLAGLVEAVGPGVTRFKEGDAVMGDLSNSGFGAFAEEVCAPETALVTKPEQLSFEEAAALPLAGITALQALRDGLKLQAGEKLLLHGAGGGVGTFAVQVAKALGAEVTALSGPANLQQSLSLGADHVIDYTREDFAASGPRYNAILACNGDRRLADYRRALLPKGRYVMVGGSWAQMKEALLKGPWLALFGRMRASAFAAKSSASDLAWLAERVREGRLRPVLDRRFPLEQAAEAMTYLETGHARGKVVLTLA